MQHRANDVSTMHGHQIQDPMRQIHRRLAWALGAATCALIINAVLVIILFEVG